MCTAGEGQQPSRNGRLTERQPARGLDKTASPLETARWMQRGVDALIPAPQWETSAGAQVTSQDLPVREVSVRLRQDIM